MSRGSPSKLPVTNLNHPQRKEREDPKVLPLLLCSPVARGYVRQMLAQAVLDAHRRAGVDPLLDDGALAGDAAGAALQATGVVEGLHAVLIDLVQGRGADADQLEELLVVGLGTVVLGQLDVRSLLVELVLVDGQRLVDVDRDLANLAHSAFTAFMTSRPSLNMPRFLMMGFIRFISGRCGAPSTLNIALKTSLTITG